MAGERAVSGYYDRTGAEITEERYVALMTRPGYKTVAETEVPGTESVVVTEWMGMNQDYRYPVMIDRPVIFQTLVRGGGMSGRSFGSGVEGVALARHGELVDTVTAEHDAFLALAADPEVAAAVRLIEQRAQAHLDAHRWGADTSTVYDRLARALLVREVPW